MRSDAAAGLLPLKRLGHGDRDFVRGMGDNGAITLDDFQLPGAVAVNEGDKTPVSDRLAGAAGSLVSIDVSFARSVSSLCLWLFFSSV